MTNEEAKIILANIDRRVCDDELSEALDMAINALEQTIWIPYKERKPDKNGKYLCCFDGGYVTAIIYDSGEFLIKDCTPIAWMPLPEPYKAESEDKE